MKKLGTHSGNIDRLIGRTEELEFKRIQRTKALFSLLAGLLSMITGVLSVASVEWTRGAVILKPVMIFGGLFLSVLLGTTIILGRRGRSGIVKVKEQVASAYLEAVRSSQLNPASL